MIQATERGAEMVLVDDRHGHYWAQSHGLDCHGTLWVLRELRVIGVIPALAPVFQRLQRAGHRLPREQVNALLREFDET